jgi:hypothetical protein
MNTHQLIAEVSRAVVAQLAPQELPLFQPTCEAYFRSPASALKVRANKDTMLGFGTGEVVALLTPIVLAIVAELVTFLTVDVRKVAADQSATMLVGFVKRMFERRRGDAKTREGAVAPLTPDQLAQVRRRAYEKARDLKLSEAQARLLADAIAGNLALPSP